MSPKIHLLHLHLNFFPDNFGVVNYDNNNNNDNKYNNSNVVLPCD